MIHVPCWCPLDAKPWFEAVLVEQQNLVAAFTPQVLAGDRKNYPAISTKYNEQKEVLLKIFSYKCAYCEKELTKKTCDVEHFRPKGGARNADNTVSRRMSDGLEHPGYYWLAFDWSNLLPSCIDCNRPGNGFGKHMKFPVRGFRAFEPGDESREEPLLLNPWFDDPTPHFKFSPSTGIIAGTTEQGRACKDIFLLNRDDLTRGRRVAYELAWNAVFSYFEAIKHKNRADKKRLAKRICDFWLGRLAFSAVGRLAINDATKNIHKDSDGFFTLEVGKLCSAVENAYPR